MACSHCNRAIEARPNDLCASLIHWKAWSEKLAAALREAIGAPRRTGLYALGLDAGLSPAFATAPRVRAAEIIDLAEAVLGEGK